MTNGQMQLKKVNDENNLRTYAQRYFLTRARARILFKIAIVIRIYFCLHLYLLISSESFIYIRAQPPSAPGLPTGRLSINQAE
jgi:hypothetical protein